LFNKEGTIKLSEAIAQHIYRQAICDIFKVHIRTVTSPYSDVTPIHHYAKTKCYLIKVLQVEFIHNIKSPLPDCKIYTVALSHLSLLVTAFAVYKDRGQDVFSQFSTHLAVINSVYGHYMWSVKDGLPNTFHCFCTGS